MFLPSRAFAIAFALVSSALSFTCFATQKSAHQIESLLLTHPDSSSLCAQLATIYFEDGSIDGRHRAIEAMKQALRLEPGNAAYHVMLGQIFLASTFWHYGVGELEKALEIDPENDAALYLSGKAFLDRALEGWQRKWFLKAERRFAQVPAQSEFYHLACRYRAQALFDGGFTDSALAVMAKIDNDSLQTDDMLMLGMLWWKRKDMKKASDWFMRAIDKMDQLKRERYLSIDLIASDTYWEQLGSQDSVDSNKRFDLFWRRHDPDPATPINERLVEHIARVAFADFHFSIPRLNKPGSKTTRGEVLIRYGLPLKWSYDPFGTGLVADETVMPQESDLGRSLAHNILSDYDPGDRYRSRPMRVSKPVWTWQYPNFTLNFEDAFLNGDFSFPYERDWSAYVYAYLKKHIPEIYESQIRKHINVVIDALACLDEKGHEALKIIWAADTRGITYEENMRWPRGGFEIHLAVLDSVYNSVTRESFEEELCADSSAIYLTQYPLISAHTINIPEGSYIAAVSLTSLSNGAVGHASVPTRICKMSDRFSLSDIELRFRENGPPNPSHTFLRNSKVYVAFEIYNLTPDSSRVYGATITYDVKRKAKPASLLYKLLDRLKLASAEQAITAFSGSYRTFSTCPRTEVVLGIDVSELLGGDYVIEVSASDLSSGLKATASTPMTIASGIDQ